MIHETDEQLRKWVEGVAADVEVGFQPPAATTEGTGVTAYLFQIAPKPRPRGDRRPPLQVEAHYLVTAFAPDVARAHELVSELIFAAMQATEYDVDPAPPPPALWSALGVPPRPGFVLKATVRKTLPDVEVKPVLKPLVIEPAVIVSLHGRVVTPDDVPVVGASVEIRALETITRTDTRGRFVFPAIPGEPKKKTISIVAKGKERLYTSEERTSAEDPLVIRFDPREG